MSATVILLSNSTNSDSNPQSQPSNSTSQIRPFQPTPIAFGEANLIWGFYTTMMVSLAYLLNQAYNVNYSALKNQKPVSTWSKFKTYQQISWGSAWLVWISSQFVTNSILSSALLIQVYFVPIISSVVNLLFAILIWRGYDQSTLTRQNDESFGYFYSLLMMIMVNLIFAQRLFPVFLQESLSAQSKNEVCFDDDGAEIECWKKALEKAQKEKEAEREQVLEEQKIANGGFLWECEKDDSCGPPCAKFDYECPAGQPEQWFDYLQLATADAYFTQNQRMFYRFPMETGFRLYALLRQGRYGDNPFPQPSSMYFISYMKWTNWEAMRGTERHIAQKEYMDLLVGIDMLDKVPEGFCVEAGLCYEDGTPVPSLSEKIPSPPL